MPILFVGGVHGVGKSTMCTSLAHEFSAEYWSASELIKTEKATAVAQHGKLVANVNNNQDLLTRAFHKRLLETKARLVILDGHFSLRDTTTTIQTLPPNLFSELGITDFTCIYDDAPAIAARIHERDKQPATANGVSELQEVEMQNAKRVALELRKPLHLVRAFDNAGLKKAAEQALGAT